MKIEIYRNKKYGTYYYSKQYNRDDLTSFDDTINYQSTKKECYFVKEIDFDTILETAQNGDYPKCEFCEDQTEVYIKRGLHLVRKPCPFCSNLNEEIKPIKENKGGKL